MKTRAAVIRDVGKEWEVAELELDDPKAGEVRIRFVAAGLCPTDEHMRTGEMAPPCPVVGGHEGAGVVEEVGAGVTRVAPGDHVVCSFTPICGHCRFCARGMSNLCDMQALIDTCKLPDDTFRFHDDQDFGQAFLLGTFAERSVVSELSCVRIDRDLPLETMAVIGCAVPAGWGTAVRSGAVQPGDTTLVLGIGGTGINAVQGAVAASAAHVVAVDPVAGKRDAALRFGATHVAADAESAQALVDDLTDGVGADQALVTVGTVTEDVVSAAFEAIRKGGTVVVTGISAPGRNTIQLPGFDLTSAEKRVVGSVFGGGNPYDTIPQMIDLYRAGRLKIDELITARYRLEDINQGFRDMHEGRNLRGIVVFD